MPALDYDYDYYEYRNGRRVTGSSYNNKVGTNRVATTRSANPRVNANRTYQTTVNRKINTATKTTQKRVTTNKTKTIQKTVTNNILKRKSNIDIPLESSKKIANKPKEMTLKKPVVEEKAKISFASAIKNVALVSVFFFLFFLVCYRYSLINEQFNGINKLKKELTVLETTNEQLQADIESKTDLTYVERYAKYQLGMQKPTSSQIQYINVEKKDRITTPVTIDEEEELNWFEKAVSEIRKIID